MKIGMQLPFTLKNKHRNTNLVFDALKSTILDPQKSGFLIFEENPQTFFSSCFGFDSALKTIDAHMFFWPVFLKTHKKKLLTVKNAILAIFGI